MRIERFEVLPFSLAFKQPFATARAQLERRELVLVKMTTRDGLVGWGEAAPLVAYDRVTLSAVVRALRTRCAPAFEGGGFLDMEQAHAAVAPDVPAPARAAIDIAAHDLLAKAQGVSLCQSLGTVARTRVPVNATIAAREPDAIADAGRAAVFAGFKTIKLKMGFPNDQDRLAALRDAIGPDLTVRLDVNGGWTPDQANACIAIVANYNVELIEQPVDRHDIAGMHKVHTTSPIPIVADESVANAIDLERINKANACDGVVVKVSSSGGVTPAGALLDYAWRAGLNAYLSSTLDGPVGIAAALHLAASRARLTTASGLATLDLFSETIADGPVPPVDGMIAVPEGAGLGITINEDALAALRIDVE